MSRMTVRQAEKLLPPPPWASAQDYRRQSEPADADGGVFIMDTATIIDDPFATVGVEWQTTVRADGTVGPTLESLRVTTGDDTAYIDSKHLARTVFVLCHAALKAGVAL